ncbi:hypothetical protein FA13DRAFT_1730778 [Coprinellus micaceus]|uniref:Uncharacterized protein n=1 Tax=Coprinellus micaceus TaxID=71717 RepID=A0A4Y7TFU9_COPMI|nr:hypothetical protein FA13DRAFT_1730778 [Coprinellus micaceus]
MPRPATKYDGVLISPPIFITATNTSGHRKLYPVFKDKTDPDVHLVQCDECGRFISLPGSKSLVRMERHTRSKECSNLKTKNERWKLQDQVRAEAEAALLSSGLVHRLVEPPARPRVQPRPIVEAQSLVSSAGPVSFSIPLHVSGSRSANSPFERVMNLSTPVQISAGSLGPQLNMPEETRRSSLSASATATTMANTRPDEERRPHSGYPPHPIPRSFETRRRVSAAASTPDFSSDSEDDSVGPPRRRSATAEESEPDLSDGEVEDIRRRATRYTSS